MAKAQRPRDNFQKHCNLIRKAWASGKRTVLLDGRVFKLKLQKRRVSFTLGGTLQGTGRNPVLTGGKTTRRTERWIIATLRDGDALTGAIYSVEPTKDENIRSYESASRKKNGKTKRR